MLKIMPQEEAIFREEVKIYSISRAKKVGKYVRTVGKG